MSQRTSTQRRSWKERALSLLLAAALMTGLIPGLTLPASAEHWADAYLDQLVDWGVMRADQTDSPDADLTRAEFFAVINRAYNYTEKGVIPFEDVLETDWFYDDISIAYTAGYMAGTSPTTASPNDPLTREQAFCILGRNMMLKDAPGESLAFSDSRDVSDWARGTIKAAADNYIISGYPDNTLHPQDSISKGQMAVLISQCLGTPVRESGEYDLGGVFGNVTITAPNVTLRNTTISGDLYISGGVGLGGIKLENVDVLGRIIVSSTGESEGGSASVIMRNVTADEMLVDNMRNKTVTIRADGITNIANTIVRTNAYIEDNNTDEEGLLHIELDGDPGTRLTLAGRIKEVVNKTPSSYIQAAKGTVAKLTVDEAATSSTVQIDRNTKINEVNLDVATDVLGDGDIGQLNVNAPGSVVTMLPDKIYVRPGLTATVAGVIMDYQAAEEGSLDPRLLSGYPAAKDIAPTGFRADFAGNKKGTVYWAVSYVSDGSIGEDDLISPPSYGSKAVANGSVAAPTGGDEVSAQVGNLVVGGSYYLSAILVDEQKERSPVKVISFSTPDNTVPAFGQGYPYMSRTTCEVAQVTVMPTKSCKLYYALLPQGAKAPTANELKAAAVTGNLGYGMRDVTKNTEEVFTVNNQRLEELKTYVLYLWLTDVDGANSSAVTSLQFTIPDETPPVVDPIPYPAPGGTTGTSISMRTGLNEPGTVYWAVVKQGDPYPLPNMQSDPPGRDNNLDPLTGLPISSKLDSRYAKDCVAAGRGALPGGFGRVAVANAGTEVTFNITGLEPETAYDLYYIGQDNAAVKNYSERVGKITIKTLDTRGPVVYQYFTNYQGLDPTERPMANTDIILYFNEDITVNHGQDLLTLYETSQGRGAGRGDAAAQASAREQLLLALRGDPDVAGDENFWLFQRTATDPRSPVPEWDGVGAAPLSWVNYEEVVVRRAEDGVGVEVVFPSGKAVSLASNSTYFFELRNIWDTAEPANRTVPNVLSPNNIANVGNTEHVLKTFQTVFAQVNLARGQGSQLPKWVPSTGDALTATNAAGKVQGDNSENPNARMDANFLVTPQSTKDAGDVYSYDLVLFAERAVSFDLYYRIVDKATGRTPYKPGQSEFDENKLTDQEPIEAETNGWVYLGNKATNKTSTREWETGSLNFDILRLGQAEFPKLNDLGEDVTYEFAISVTRWEGSDQFESWDSRFNFQVFMLAGLFGDLQYLRTTPKYTPSGVVSAEDEEVYSIGVPDSVTLPVSFVASAQPVFAASYPTFGIGDTFKELTVGLNNPGTLYYMIVPKNGTGLQTKITVTNTVQTSLGQLNPGDVIDTSVNATENRQKLWEVVSAQMALERQGTHGQLISDSYGEHPYYYRVDGTPDRDLIPRGQGFISGSCEYEYMGGVPQTFTIPGGQYTLDPNTDYYLYVVLEAESGSLESRSNVYIFNFKTTDTAAPEINLSNTTYGGGRVAVRTTNDPPITADITYLLITKSALDTIGLLNEPFSQYVREDRRSEYTKGSSYTVLQALIDPYRNGSDVSVFDYFATEGNNGVKGQVYNLITSNPGAIGWGREIRVIGDKTEMVDHTPDMTPSIPYYLLAVGKHVSGTSLGFRAIDNVLKPDTVPPQISSIETSVTESSLGRVTDDKVTQPHITGDVTIRFTKAVYWIKPNQAISRVPVLNKAGTSNNTYKYILDVVSASNKKNMSLEDPSTSNEAASTFVFGIKEWYDSSTITFFGDDALVANDSGEALASAVQLTLHLVTSTSATGITTVDRAYFTATWSVSENGTTVTYTYDESTGRTTASR